MHTKEFIEEMRAQLLKEKSSLENELLGLKRHTELGSDNDANAQEVEEDELNYSITLRINEDLEKINAALLRVENGTYGIDAGGREIPEDRLRALPWADSNI